jgi:hypothetical protein
LKKLSTDKTSGVGSVSLLVFLRRTPARALESHRESIRTRSAWALSGRASSIVVFSTLRSEVLSSILLNLVRVRAVSIGLWSASSLHWTELQEKGVKTGPKQRRTY